MAARQAWARLRNLPVSSFGNRIPNLAAELSFKSTGGQPWLMAELIDPAEGGVFPESQASGLAVDRRRGAAYLLRSDSDSTLVGTRR